MMLVAHAAVVWESKTAEKHVRYRLLRFSSNNRRIAADVKSVFLLTLLLCSSCTSSIVVAVDIMTFRSVMCWDAKITCFGQSLLKITSESLWVHTTYVLSCTWRHVVHAQCGNSYRISDVLERLFNRGLKKHWKAVYTILWRHIDYVILDIIGSCLYHICYFHTTTLLLRPMFSCMDL